MLFHPTEIVAGFRTTVHIGNIRQTAVIEGIFPVKGMKSSDQASVMFRYRQTLKWRSVTCLNVCRFIKNPEFVKVGAKILFREGRTKGLGALVCNNPFILVLHLSIIY